MNKKKDKLKDILEKYFLFEECMIDSLIRIDKIGTEVVHPCRECTVADIVREDMIGTVFCPLMMKRDLEFRVK